MADIDQTGIPYSQYLAAYKQVYGKDKNPPLDPGMANYYAQNPDAIYTQQYGAVQGQIPLSTLMAIAGSQSGTATAGTGGTAGATGGTAGSTGTGGATGTGGTAGTAGGTQSYLGGTGMATIDPRANTNFMLPNGQALTPQQTQKVMDLYSRYESGDAGAGQNLIQWTQQMGISTGDLDAGVNNLRSGTGANAPPQMTSGIQPESAALQQMGQIDPASEALRSQLGQSYLTSLQNVSQPPAFGLDLSRGAAAPAAGDVQSYLDLYKQIDPQGYAERTGLATSMDQYLQGAQQEAALGAQLDPATQREVEQATRSGQQARGNVYGTPQLVQEAMERGTAGEARRQQRQAALSSALGQQQSYLGSGLGLGDVANNLYNQGYNRYLSGYGSQLAGWQAGQGARQQAQQNALSYLGSGQTPYQAGSSYLQNAEARAANAAQGGPVYNPASLGQSYGASQFPQYGLDIGNQATNYFNSLNAYSGGGAPGKNKGAAAAAGALSGAASGAMAGAPLAGATYGLSIPIGAVVGGALGGAGGYFG